MKSFEMVAREMYFAYCLELSKHQKTSRPEWAKLSTFERNAWIRAAWAANTALQGVH